MSKALIIGGGMGGLTAAKMLRSKNANVEIIMVEPKEYFELGIFSYRLPFDEVDRNNAIQPLKPWTKKHNITLIQSIVQELTTDRATLANGDTIKYDVCLVATGAGAPWKACGRGPTAPATMEERKAALKAEGDLLLDAKSVLVVGGGIIGCELAGDLAYFQKLKHGKIGKITIVQSPPRLCMEMPKAASKYIKQKLEHKGVKIILNEKASEKDGKMFLKNSGKEVDAEQVVYSSGLIPVNSFMDAKYLNEKGWLQADENFRVKGSGGKIFTLGDCCDLLYNSGNSIKANADIIGENLATTLQAKADNKMSDSLELKHHATAPAVFITSVGKDDGVFNYGWLTTQWIFPRYKNTKLLEAVIASIGIKM